MWVDKILLRLKITPTDKILLDDSLGLFRMNEVRDYLLTKGFKVFDVSSLTELSNISRNNQRGLFFFADSNIPNSIKERFHYIQITKNNLSYDIDPILIENINNTELVLLLSQVYQTNFTQSISLENYQEILHQAKKDNYIIRREKLIQTFENYFKTDFTYDALLEAGKLLGKIIHEDYLYDIENYLIPDSIVEKTEEYIVSEKYNNIFYESQYKPKTVDKILPYIKTLKIKKLALICFDCMGIPEWLILREYLKGYIMEEHSALALIPTITSISRKAIFSGNLNIYKKTGSDEKLFLDNFEDKSSVAFFANKDEITQNNILGYNTICKVFNLFDDLAHGVVIPKGCSSKRLYFKQLDDYIKGSNILETINILVNNDFNVFLCSDHGSTIAVGNGLKFEKWVKEISGKRAFLTSNLQHVEQNNVKIYQTPANKIYAVIAENKAMFDHNNSIGIVHGGISLEELVVPFIDIKGRKIDDRI